MEPLDVAPQGVLTGSSPARLDRAGTRALLRGPLGVGVGLFVVIVLVCVLSPFFTVSPTEPDILTRLAAPSAQHWLGTDGSGRDVFSRTLQGGRVDILLGTLGVLLSFVIGSAAGLLLGFFGGRLSELIMRLLDVIQAFPLLVFSLAMLTFLRPRIGIYSTFIATIAFVAVPIFIRLVRAETLSMRSRSFVEAAICVGNPTRRVMFRHVLPNVITSALTQLTSSMASAILLIGALSFLGVGVQPPAAEWGSMIKEGTQYTVTGVWWPAVFPGLGIILTVLALHLMGEGFVERRRVA
jgi:peptide/nickel transport system permease protein